MPRAAIFLVLAAAAIAACGGGGSSSTGSGSSPTAGTPRAGAPAASAAAAARVATSISTAEPGGELSARVPNCAQILTGAMELFRVTTPKDKLPAATADEVTVSCASAQAQYTVVVARFRERADAQRADAQLREGNPAAVKDRRLDLDRVAAEAKGGFIMPDTMGGQVTVSFRQGNLTGSVVGMPSAGARIDDEAVTLASALAKALG